MTSPGVTIRLQGLPVTASSADIRKFFSGLNIPDGGVHIIGGENGEAFITFSSDEDGRLGMLRNNADLSGSKIMLYLSSKSEMQSVIDELRNAAVPPPVPFPGNNPAAAQMGNFYPNSNASFSPTNQPFIQSSQPPMFQGNQMQNSAANNSVPSNVPWGQPSSASAYNQQNQSSHQPGSGYPNNFNFPQNPQNRPMNDQHRFNQAPGNFPGAQSSGDSFGPPGSGGQTNQPGGFYGQSQMSGNNKDMMGDQSSKPGGSFAPPGSNFDASRSDFSQGSSMPQPGLPTGVSDRGDTDFFRGPVDSPRAAHTSMNDSSRGKGDFSNRGGGNFPVRGRGDYAGRGDFSNRGRGDFSSRGGGDFSSRGGGDFSSRGGGDFSSQGGGDFSNRGGHADYSSRGRADFSNRGRGDFSNRSSGDFSNQGSSDFSNRGGGNFSNRGRGDFSNRGRGDFSNRGGGDFSNRGRGDFSSHRGGAGDFSMRGGSDFASRGSHTPQGPGFGKEGYPPVGSTGQGNTAQGGFPSNSFGPVVGSPSANAPSQMGNTEFNADRTLISPTRGRGDFSRGRGSGGDRGSFSQNNQGSFDASRGSFRGRGGTGSFNSTPSPSREQASRSNESGSRHAMDSKYGSSSFDSHGDDRGRGYSDNRTSGQSRTDSYSGSSSRDSAREPPRSFDREDSRSSRYPQEDFRGNRDSSSRTNDRDMDRRGGPPYDTRTLDDRYSSSQRSSTSSGFTDRKIGDNRSFDRGDRNTFGGNDSRSDSRGGYNERKRSNDRDISESYNKRALLEKPPKPAYCLLENAPLSITASDVDAFLSQRPCKPVIKPIILTRQKFCLVYVKFADEFQAERCSQLNGKTMRSSKIFIHIVSSDDFNKANVEFQTQINKEIFQRAKADNYKGLFLELSGLPVDVSGEDVSEIIGGIPLQVDDLYVEYNRHGIFVEPNIAYVRLIGQPDVNRALRYSGEPWKGRKINILQISATVHYQKLKSHYYATYESASSSSKQYKDDRPPSSDSRKRSSPANSADSRKSDRGDSRGRNKTPPKAKACPDNVCVEIMHLPVGTEKRDIREFFRKMKVMHVIFDTQTPGKAYVEFEKEREQIAALRMNNHKLKNNEIKILAFDSKDYLRIYNLSKVDKKTDTPPEKTAKVELPREPSRNDSSRNQPPSNRGPPISSHQPMAAPPSFNPMQQVPPPHQPPQFPPHQAPQFAQHSNQPLPHNTPQHLPPQMQNSLEQKPVASPFKPTRGESSYLLSFARATRVNVDFLRKFLQISAGVILKMRFAPGPAALCEEIAFKCCEKPVEHFLGLSGKSFVGIVVTIKCIEQSHYDYFVQNIHNPNAPPYSGPQSAPFQRRSSTDTDSRGSPQNLQSSSKPATKRLYCIKFSKPLNLKTEELRKFLRMGNETMLSTKPASMQNQDSISEVYVSTFDHPHHQLVSFNNRWFCQVQLDIKAISESDYEIEIAVISKMKNPTSQKAQVCNEPLDKCMAKLSQLPDNTTNAQIQDFLRDISIRKNGICVFADKNEAIVFFETSTDREKALKRHHTFIGKQMIRVENCYLSEAMGRVPPEQFNPIALVGFPEVTDSHTITMAENIPKDCDAKQLQELLKPLKIMGITFMRSCSIAFVLLNCSVDVQLSQLKSNNFIGSHKIKLTPKTKEEMNQIIEEFKRESGDSAAREAAVAAAVAQDSKSSSQAKSPVSTSRSEPSTPRSAPFPVISPNARVNNATPEFAVLMQNIPVTVIKKDIIDFFQDITTITESRVFLKTLDNVSEAIVILTSAEETKVASEHNQNYVGPKRVSVKILTKEEISKQLSIYGAILSPSTVSSKSSPNSTGFDPITLRVSGLPIDVKAPEVLQFFRDFDPNESYLTLNCDPITRACTAQITFDNRQRGLQAMKDRQGQFLGGRKIVITTV